MKIRIATFINISDFQFRAGESCASFGSIFLVPVRIYCFKSWNRRSKSGSAFFGKFLDPMEKYRFSLQLYTRMHGFKDAFFFNFWGGLTQRLRRLLSSLNLWLRLRFGFRPQFSGACAIDRLNRFGFRPQFTPSMFINPSPNKRGLDQTLFPNPNFLSSSTLDPKSGSKST